MTDALAFEGVDVTYRVSGQDRRVLSGLDLRIAPGEAYGLVGESGSGKSTAALAAVRYLAHNGRVSAGRILIDGQDLMTLPRDALRQLRSHTLSMVYQDPARALNPSLRICRQMAEVFEVSEGLKGKPAQDRAARMLARVRIADHDRVLRAYPHELSGGMQQRVVIAMALSNNPALLILDEPTTALDATVEAEILDLLAALRADFSTAILFISHNLKVVARLCDRVGVLYAGELVEEGPRARSSKALATPIRWACCAPCPGRDCARTATGLKPSPASHRRRARQPPAASTPAAARSRPGSATAKPRRWPISADDRPAATIQSKLPNSIKSPPPRWGRVGWG